MVGRGIAGAGDGIGECPPFFGEIGEGQSFSLSSAFFLPSRIPTPLSKHHVLPSSGCRIHLMNRHPVQTPNAFKSPNRSFKHVPPFLPIMTPAFMSCAGHQSIIIPHTHHQKV